MASAEQMRERFLQRVSPPGPTDEKLAVTLGLLPERPANGKRRRPVTTKTPAEGVPDMEDHEADGGGGVEVDDQPGGGEGLEAVVHLFPAPPALAPADGPPPVKLGFPVPVPLMREVAHFKLDLSRHLNRRVSNHEIGAVALQLLPKVPASVAELLRRHAPRIGLDTEAPPVPARRLVASVPMALAAGVEDLVLGVEETEGIRVTKSQLWALAHALLLDRAAS
jgi:hypothetical protein